MSTARVYHSCIVIEDEDTSKKVLVIGGSTKRFRGPRFNSTELYDISTQRWTNGINLPFTVSGSALVGGNTKHAAYIIGGFQDYQRSSRVFGMIRKTGIWEEVGSFSKPRHDHVAFQVSRYMIDQCSKRF